jgi:hypothetical protein
MRAHLLDTAVWEIVERFLTDERVIVAKIKPWRTQVRQPTADRHRAAGESRWRAAAASRPSDRNLDDDEAAPLVEELKSLSVRAREIEAQRSAAAAARGTFWPTNGGSPIFANGAAV